MMTSSQSSLNLNFLETRESKENYINWYKKMIKQLVNIVHKILLDWRKFTQKKYFENSPTRLKYSTFNFDIRNPVKDRKYVSLGEDCIINANCVFESDTGFIKIGNRVFIGGATLISRSCIQIDDDVEIAWGCLLYDHNSHSFDYRKRRKDIDMVLQSKRKGIDILRNMGKNWNVVHTAPIHICHDAWIGANVTILNGVTIGAGAIVGAGSVVRKDVPAWSIVAGNPAVIIGWNKYNESSM